MASARIAGMTAQQVERRADGWPLCPHCGADELYSHVMLGWDGRDPRPTLADCLAGGFACYRCGGRLTLVRVG